MNFRLTLNSYRVLISLVWGSYTILCIIVLLAINHFELKVSVAITGIIIKLTIIEFIENWYLYRQPKLLDWFRLAIFLTVVLNFLSLINILDNSTYIEIYSSKYVDSDTALTAICAVLIGLIGLRISELLIRFKRKKIFYKRRYTVIKNVNILFSLGVFVGSFQTYLLLNSYTGYGVYTEHTTASYSFVLQIVKILAGLILGLLAIYKYKFKYRSRKINYFFWGFLALQVLIGFLSGMKEDLITPIILVIIPYLIGGNKVSKKLIGISIVALLIIYPLVNNYRSILNENPQLSKSSSFVLAGYQTYEKGFLNNIISGSQSYQERVSLFPTLMFSIETEDKWTAYKYLDRYLYLPVSWVIPRYFLPNKPVSDSGAKLYQMVTNRNTSSITPSTIGWAYLEGGHIYVFISFFVFGWFVSLIQHNINKNSLFGLLLYMMLLVSLLKAEFDIYFKLSSILQIIFIGLLFKYFFIESKNGSWKK